MAATSGLLYRGGATRILIIDDDPRPDPMKGADSRPLLPDEPADASAAPEPTTLPVMHEYQMANPVPLRSDEELEVQPVETNGAPDVSIVRELIARVEELLHRTRALPSSGSTGWSGTVRFGTVTVEPATQTVLRGGHPVRVTHTEFRLLLALMRRRGAIASRMELLREVWGVGAAVSRRAVDTHIARLRRKLEEDPANPRHILTALAWGYRFRP